MLRKTGSRWEFESELALENFAWANLKSLFGLTALKRQYYSNGEICDILALDKERRLVIIELKNCARPIHCAATHSLLRPTAC